MAKGLKPTDGFVIIKREERKGFKQDKDKQSVLPPSDYFIVDPGKTEYVQGQEVVLHGAAMLIPLFKIGKDIYVMNANEIIAKYI